MCKYRLMLDSTLWRSNAFLFGIPAVSTRRQPCYNALTPERSLISHTLGSSSFQVTKCSPSQSSFLITHVLKRKTLWTGKTHFLKSLGWNHHLKRGIHIFWLPSFWMVITLLLFDFYLCFTYFLLYLNEMQSEKWICTLLITNTNWFVGIHCIISNKV